MEGAGTWLPLHCSHRHSSLLGLHCSNVEMFTAWKPIPQPPKGQE